MSNGRSDAALNAALRRVARPLAEAADLDPLMEQIGDARFVLMGEASHGTSEYYTWRARLSKRLIAEKGFSFIAVEGDWPDCYKVNRYVKGHDEAGSSARDVLATFSRWPTWMWANWEVTALAEWLREFNQTTAPERQVGFYGLDVYSLWESLEEILGYLDKTDAETAQSAREAINCFAPYNRSEHAYAWATHIVPTTCEEEVIQLLLDIRRKAHDAQSAPGDTEMAFNAEQNALIAVDAERYYRAMIVGGAGSWNVRDTHMVETLDRLMQHHGDGAKAIVWEHNTHIGDARATDMADAGMVNVGQLVRERHADEGVVLVGFGSHRGSVIAGTDWGAPMERMPVPDAREGSWEDLLHRAIGESCLISMSSLGEVAPLFERPRGHRAIGVVYNPNQERYGNYVPTVLSQRYDAFLYIDETHALHPLHIEPEAAKEPPETYPWAV